MKVLLGILLLTMVSCGTDDGSSAANGSKQPDKAGQFNKRTLVKDTADDLPVCNKDNDDQLVYVKDEKQFYECDTGDWLAIDISGKQGVSGSNGVDGKDGYRKPADNLWEDPITQKLWLIGSVQPYTAGLCSSGWRLPTKAEGQDALTHGLYQHASNYSGPTSFWTSENLSPTSKWVWEHIDTVSALATHDQTSESYGVYCVEE